MNIEISNSTHDRLVKEMRSNETCELVISRLLDNLGGVSMQSVPLLAKSSDEYQDESDKEEFVFKQGALPYELRFSRVHNLLIDNMPVPKPNWNKAVDTILIELEKKGKDALSHNIVGLAITQGKHEEGGYRYIPKIKKSIQGLDSNNSARIITYLAKENRMDIELTFLWGRNPKALHPGEQGKIIMTSSKE